MRIASVRSSKSAHTSRPSHQRDDAGWFARRKRGAPSSKGLTLSSPGCALASTSACRLTSTLVPRHPCASKQSYAEGHRVAGDHLADRHGRCQMQRAVIQCRRSFKWLTGSIASVARQHHHSERPFFNGIERLSVVDEVLNDVL